MILRSEACACIVRKSASSKITTLSGLKEATLANPCTLSLIVSMPRSSEALMYRWSQSNFPIIILAKVVLPQPAGP